MPDLKQGDRKFYDLPKSVSSRNADDAGSTHPEILSKYINDNIIGRNVVFIGPFGKRQVVYCDYIASGKSLKTLSRYRFAFSLVKIQTAMCIR